MRAAEYTPRGPFRVFELRHGLTEIFERGTEFTSHTSRRVVGQWGGAGGACCEDHLAFAVIIGVCAAA